MPDEEAQPAAATTLTKAERKAAAAAARQLELAECKARLSALLDEYNALLDIAIITRYRNGQAITFQEVEVIDKP